MKNKIAYYNDRIVIKREQKESFFGGYKTTYKDNFIPVIILGKQKSEGTDKYLIRLRNKNIKEVYGFELYIT
jgi:hypothetical protein